MITILLLVYFWISVYSMIMHSMGSKPHKKNSIFFLFHVSFTPASSNLNEKKRRIFANQHINGKLIGLERTWICRLTPILPFLSGSIQMGTVKWDKNSFIYIFFFRFVIAPKMETMLLLLLNIAHCKLHNAHCIWD